MDAKGSIVAQLIYITYGVTLVLVTVTLHMIYLIGSARYIRNMSAPRNRFPTLRPALILSFAAIGMILVHIAESCLWALLYFIAGQTNTVQEALYFSIVTATTLGYGDITLQGDWRIVVSWQAMSGLLLFGASTAALFQLVLYLSPMAEPMLEPPHNSST